MSDIIPIDRSDAQQLALLLTSSIGYDAAHQAIDVICRKFTNVELAALTEYWRFWARKKQLAPKGRWRSWGTIAGRGWGKSLTNSKFVNEEVLKGNAPLVGICAQKLDMTIAIQVNGPSGLIATSPPWFKAEYKPSEFKVIWPNGSYAIARTPEVPGEIRGLEYHLFWCTEFQSWPKAHMAEAHDNVLISTRLGYARTVWDASAKRGHALLKERIAMAEAEPEKHILTRGSTYENADNLGEGYVEDLERKYKGTKRGAEELEGDMGGDEDDAVTTQAIIDEHRRPRPDKFRRKAIGIDPAVTARKGSDTTGIVLAGEGQDGDCYVLGDRTGKYAPGQWTKITVDWYVKEEVDLVVVETNKGGDLVVTAIRAEAQARSMSVVVIGKDEQVPERRKGVIFIREVHSRGSKMDRAEPVSVAYGKGRMHHVAGVDLNGLEDTLTGWVAKENKDSPGDLDALVSAATELLGLKNDLPDPKLSMVGVPEMSKRLRDGGLGRGAVGQLLRGHGSRGI